MILIWKLDIYGKPFGLFGRRLISPVSNTLICLKADCKYELGLVLP